MRRTLGIAMAIASGAAWRWARRAALPSYAGRHVLITGGSRGLGLCMARLLADEGAHLTLLARDPLELDEARARLEPFGVRIHTAVCDVGNRTQVEDAVTRAAQVQGGIDVVINNAGVIQVGPLQHMREEDFTRSLQTHFYGPLHVTLSALPFLRSSVMPRVVNIASVGGRVALPHMLPYTASKFALVGLSQGLHTELAAERIPVTTVVPGLMRTGSHLHAILRGDHQREYLWFARSDLTPGLSKDADQAAKRILEAARAGQAYVSLTLAAGALSTFVNVFPNAGARLLEAIHRLLPAPVGEEGDETVEGADMQYPLEDPLLDALGERAAVRNNQV